MHAHRPSTRKYSNGSSARSKAISSRGSVWMQCHSRSKKSPSKAPSMRCGSRLQSAMFDRDTLTITYDMKRGEPRGPRSKKVDRHAAGLGDCLDCHICVQVCPVGIDIRQGLQYECIGCGACIDGCNQ